MLLYLESSNVDQTDISMANNDVITKLPSACHQSTQTEDIEYLTKESPDEDIFEGQGTNLPSQFQSVTDV